MLHVFLYGFEKLLRQRSVHKAWPKFAGRPNHKGYIVNCEQPAVGEVQGPYTEVYSLQCFL